MKTLSDILDQIMPRLLGKPRAETKAGLRRQTAKLIDELAERERRMDRLERIGMQRHGPENLYTVPKKLEN